jgi:competence protein ComEA
MRRAALAFTTLLAFAGPASATVDVNTATKEQLEAEGMGPVAAQALVDYRTKNGPFKSADEVRKVISDAIAGKLSVGISISGPASAPPAPAPSAAASPPPAPSVAASPAPSAPAVSSVPSADKGTESKPREDDDKTDNVRNRAKKDQDDRKT